MKAFAIVSVLIVVSVSVWFFGSFSLEAATGSSKTDESVLDCPNGIKASISISGSKNNGDPWDVGSTADPAGRLDISGRSGSWSESINKRQDQIQFTVKLFRGKHVTLYKGDVVSLFLRDFDVAFNDPIINAEFVVDGVSFSKGALEEMVFRCR
jgi:hypothetical protein